MASRLVDIISYSSVSSPPPVETNPPFLQNQVPAPGTLSVNIGSNIAFRITDAADDANSGVDLTSLVVRLQFGAGPLVTVYNGSAGGAQPGYAVSAVDVFSDQMSYDIVINPTVLLPGNMLVTVYVDVDDLQTLVNNHLGTNYNFTTSPAETNPPFLQNQVPAPATTGVSPATTVAFRVTDAADDPDSGVNQSTLTVTLQNGVGQPFTPVITNGVFQSGFSGSITDVFANGLSFDVVITPASPLVQIDTVQVRVRANDTKTVPNSLDTTYAFQTTAADVTPPYVVSPAPSDGATGVDGSAPISFTVLDDDSGVNLSTLQVVITIAGTPENAVVNGLLQAGWSGSISSVAGGYFVSLLRAVPIPNSVMGVVTIDASDLSLAVNAMAQVVINFSTAFPQPQARLAQREFHALLGSIIQLDGRDSEDPDGLPLTYNWSFVSVPSSSILVADVGVVNPASLVQIFEGRRASSFIPDALGTYVVQLQVTNGGNVSTVTATVSIGLSLVPCGEGVVPDVSWLWQFLSSFWTLVEDKEYLEVMWSVLVQVISSDYVRAETHHISQSLSTVQATARLGWQKFSLRTKLSDQAQSLILGNQAAGTGADTGALIPTTEQSTRVLRVPLGTPGVAGQDDFTAIDRDYGIFDRVVEINGSGYLADRAFNQSSATASLDSLLLFDGVTYTDVTVEADDPDVGTTLWAANGDQVFIGSASPFTVLRLELLVVASGNVGFTFDFSNGAGGWTNFSPTDGTTGATASGDINLGALVGWGAQAVNGTTQFWVRITRGAAVLATPPVLTTVLEVDSYSFLLTRKERVPNNQRGVSYRISHLLHVPGLDLEALGVAAGDILVLQVTRKDAGLDAELQAQITAVSEHHLGFELTLDPLVDGEVPQPSRQQIRQLVQDLRLVSPVAADVQIAAVAEAFIHMMPVGINVAQRWWSEYQFEIKAKEVIHNSGVQISADYVSIPALQHEIKAQPETVWLENTDYTVAGGYLLFGSSMFSLSSPAPAELWAECAHIDNSETVENNFGALIGLRRGDLVRKATRAPYLSAVKGLWFAVTDHPSVKNVRLAMQILMGLPFTVADGVIVSVTSVFSTDSQGNQVGRLLVEDLDSDGHPNGNRRFYFWPTAVGLDTNPDTGVAYAAGDIVRAFVPLSLGVDVQDWVGDPRWWERELVGQEIRKFHTFRAQLDTATGVFDERDLVFTLEFLRSIRPVYTDLVAAVLQELSDGILTNFSEGYVGSQVQLRFYDQPGSLGKVQANHRSFDLNGQGEVLWRADSRPMRTVSPALLVDVVTQVNGANVEASSVTGFGTGSRTRVAGDATHPLIEGDLLSILPGQNGSGPNNPVIYEITSGSLPNGPVVLGNMAPAEEPAGAAVVPPSTAIFRPGSSLRCTVLRREMNPILRGADLQTVAGATQLANSLSALFTTNGVAVDDHLVIESGANAGEYRIVSIVAQTSPRSFAQAALPQLAETQVALVGLDGSNPALVDLSNQDFRIVRPQLVLSRVTACRVVNIAGDMYAEKLDYAGANVPFDVFTPGMVGEGLTVARADNPANNGAYTILEYIHAGRVRITSGSPQTSDAASSAEVRIFSRYHAGFERSREMGPTEVFSAVVS